MADEGVNTRPVRGSGDGATDDVSGAGLMTEAEDFDVRAGDRNVPRWVKRSGAWFVAGVALLVAYFIGIPILLSLIHVHGDIDPVVDFFGEDTFFALITPMWWLMENCPPYDYLVDCIEGLLT